MTETATPTLADLTRTISERTDAVREENERHDEAKKALLADLKDAQDKRAHLAAGTDPEVLALARSVVQVDGDVGRATGSQLAPGRSVVTDAVEDIAAGGLTMLNRYLAIKDYEGFTGQREDHKYGMGPRHGRIVFSVGLTKEARDRIREGLGLTPDQTEAAIRYLLNLGEAGTA